MKKKTVAFFKALLPIKSEDFELFAPLELPIKILKINGNWTTGESATSYWVYSIILHLCVMEICTALQILYLPHVKNFFDLTQLVTILPSSIAVSIETVVFYTHRDELQTLMEMIRECVNENGMSVQLKKHLLIIDKYMRGFLLFVLFNMASFTVATFVSRELFFKMWLPFEVDFWLGSAFQLTCLYNYCLVNLVMDTFPVFYMIYIVGMLERLCEQLEEIRAKNDSRTRLIKCIENQLRIVAINRKVQQIFSLIFLIRGFFSVAVLCTSILAINVLSDLAVFGKLASYIVIMIVSIFVPCYYGSKIKEVSGRISNALFHSEWLLEDKEYHQFVKIAMEFAEKDLKISAGGVFDVDLEKFSLICQSVYSTYCVCNQILSKN